MKKLVFLIILLTCSVAHAAQFNAIPGHLLPQAGNIVALYDATSITGVSSGSTFNSWTDSARGIVASESNPSYYPTYEANRLNGLPSVKFGGTADLCLPLTNAAQAAVDTSSYSVLIIFRALGSSSKGVLMAAATGCCNIFWYYADGSFAGQYNYFEIPYANQSSFSTVGSSDFASGTGSSGASGSLQISYVNGGAVTTSTATPPTTGGNKICFGSLAASRINLVNAEIFDIVIWNVPLTNPQYKQAEMWACDRYAQPYPWASLSAYNVFFGDSITAGTGASAITTQYPWLAAQTLRLSLGQWDNIGVGGITTRNMNALAPTWVDPLPSLVGTTINLVGFEWYNENLGVGAPPIPYNDAQTYLNARHAISNMKIVWGTSTSYNGDPSANRKSYDNAFDSACGASSPSSCSNVDSYVPIHSVDVQLGLAGRPSSYSLYCPKCTPQYWTDGIHPADGYQFLARDMVKGIQALP